MKRGSRAGGLGLLGLLLFACTANHHGHTRAKGRGDSPPVPLPRASAFAAQLAACGAPAGGDLAAVAAGVRLRRFPYLQKVKSDGATIVWTAQGIGPAARVRVWPVGTNLVREALAQVDESAPLPEGALQYVATLTGLSPATPHCYEVFVAGARLWGPARLQTAPLPHTYPLRFAVLGDSGNGGSDQAAVLRQMDAQPFDALLHVGDIAYATGSLAEFERNFFAVYRLILSQVPAFPASGNHEYLTDDAAPFRQVFVLPEVPSEGGPERYYSFDYGDVHLAALDTERVGPEQAAWLDRDLGQSRAPWKIVYGHRPPMSSGVHGSHLPTRASIVPILRRHRVPLAFFGHDHHYERFLPQDGVTYIISGGGGRGVRWLEGRHPASAHAEAVSSFVHLTIERDRATVWAIDGEGRRFDDVVVPRPQ